MYALLKILLIAAAMPCLESCNGSNSTQLSLGGDTPRTEISHTENLPPQWATEEMNQVFIDIFSTVETSEALKMCTQPIGGFTIDELLWLQTKSPKAASGETPPAILFDGPRNLLSPEDVEAMTAQLKANQNIRFDSSRIGFLASENEGLAYSVPLFSADHKRALLRMCYKKGGHCLYGESYLFEKVKGRWTEVLRFGEYEV